MVPSSNFNQSYFRLEYTFLPNFKMGTTFSVTSSPVLVQNIIYTCSGRISGQNWWEKGAKYALFEEFDRFVDLLILHVEGNQNFNNCLSNFMSLTFT